MEGDNRDTSEQKTLQARILTDSARFFSLKSEKKSNDSPIICAHSKQSANLCVRLHLFVWGEQAVVLWVGRFACEEAVWREDAVAAARSTGSTDRCGAAGNVVGVKYKLLNIRGGRESPRNRPRRDIRVLRVG
jgi:hypothetical protein